MSVTLPRGHVAFIDDTAGRARTLIVKLGASSPTLTPGVGGWESVQRPGWVPFTTWRGGTDDTLSIPLLFDGWVGYRSVENDCRDLEHMGRRPEDGARNEPPPAIRLHGAVPHRGQRWVIQTITYGDAIYHHEGFRIRQEATVELLRHRPIDLVKVVKRKASSGANRTYKVRKGDSLGTISRDQLGGRTHNEIARGVQQIKKLNGIRDAKSIRVGQTLKLPARIRPKAKAKK